MTYETPTGANMFAYCLNNPVNMTDDGGEWAHLVIGAAVGAIASGIVAAVTSYAQSGSINWKSVAINAATGAVGGFVAATGLCTGYQAALTAVASGVGNYVDQLATKGANNINKRDVLMSAVVGGMTSALGGTVGKSMVGNFEKVGYDLLEKGNIKLTSAATRSVAGKSSSALVRQGNKYVAQGSKLINTYRGASSVAGSFVGIGTGVGYNGIKASVLGW